MYLNNGEMSEKAMKIMSYEKYEHIFFRIFQKQPFYSVLNGFRT